MSESWRVYGGQPLARTFASKRAARRLMRKYARLGIQASLYSGEDGNWELCGRQDAGGRPYRLADDVPDDISGIGRA
jgi:hypothetical protein